MIRFNRALVIACLAAAVGGPVFGQNATSAVPPAALPPATGDTLRPPTAEVDADAGAEELWIGVMCADLDPALRAQLGLEPGRGVLVQEVYADSPAGKAGVRKYDILLEIDGKPLPNGNDLVAAVRQAGEQELRMALLRGGKQLAVSLRPTRRPAELRIAQPAVPEQDRRIVAQLEDWIKRNQGSQAMPPMTFRLYHPGIVLPRGVSAPGANLSAPLPDDMSIAIRREGSKPAEISVRQGDRLWQTTVDQLDKLPAEVRGHVLALVSPGTVTGSPASGGAAGEAAAAAPVQLPPSVMQQAIEQQMRQANAQMQQQMRALSDQMQQMQKRLQEMNSPRPAPPKDGNP
ncbi:MAG TPA: PDZ domain-containing protein [Pirellulales bacterium]|jgi:membrane-associated protease RseP (regulator of RpoE activity)|nr:PDZ domain-containing protein [Pirellulales bacterium]